MDADSTRLTPMKTIGILGGMSDQATAEYYRMINRAVNQRLGGWNIAELIIRSVNFAHIERFVRTADWESAGRYLAPKASELERAGAELLICVSNTLHRVAPVFTAGLTIPFLHIVDPTAEAVRAAGLRSVGLLGTLPVMQDDYLKRRYCAMHGIDIAVPDASEQTAIDRIIFDELVRGRFERASAHYYLAVMDRMRDAGVEGVIFGCTEIFLLIDQSMRPDFPMFDSASLHAQRAVELAFQL